MLGFLDVMKFQSFALAENNLILNDGWGFKDWILVKEYEFYSGSICFCNNVMSEYSLHAAYGL